MFDDLDCRGIPILTFSLCEINFLPSYYSSNHPFVNNLNNNWFFFHFGFLSEILISKLFKIKEE